VEVSIIENISDKLDYGITEEELRELLDDLPNIVKDLENESKDSYIAN
jgi:hypothetical protein